MELVSTFLSEEGQEQPDAWNRVWMGYSSLTLQMRLAASAHELWHDSPTSTASSVTLISDRVIDSPWLMLEVSR